MSGSRDRRVDRLVTVLALGGRLLRAPRSHWSPPLGDPVVIDMRPRYSYVQQRRRPRQDRKSFSGFLPTLGSDPPTPTPRSPGVHAETRVSFRLPQPVQ